MEAILSESVEAILEAAEQAAAGIREEAEEQAGLYLDESRRRADGIAAQRIREISELTDILVDRVRSVAQQSDALIAALNEAGRRVSQPAPPPYGVQPQYPTVWPPAAGSPAPYWQGPAQVPPAAPAPPPIAPRPAAYEQPPYPAPPAPELPAEDEREAAPPTREAPHISEDARLLATRMAVAGSSRDEIARRLNEEFGIEQPTAILDEIGI